MQKLPVEFIELEKEELQDHLMLARSFPAKTITTSVAGTCLLDNVYCYLIQHVRQPSGGRAPAPPLKEDKEERQQMQRLLEESVLNFVPAGFSHNQVPDMSVTPNM